jgi:transposase
MKDARRGVSMPNRRGRYPSEFRAEAVKLFRSVQGEKSMRTVATELGISNETLRSWVKQADIDEGRKEELSTEEREELRLLRRENKVLKEEREILKKAAAFFAKENGTRT